MKKNFTCRFIFSILALTFSLLLNAQQLIKGRVLAKKDNEPLVGATVLIEGTTKATSVDIDGNYQLSGVAAGNYTLVVSYVSYTTQKIPNVAVKKGEPTVQDILLEEASMMLKSVEVVAQKRTDTELSMLKSIKTAVQVVNGISSQQIGKTIDRDASEVVKRVPGVTIQDNRFIVVRGLNQRYNNVWLNNAATPSSETDVKAFSFDAIPSNMIDNLLVFKSGSPELSAEATGGFVKIFTKNIPEEDFFTAEYGLGYNEIATFKDTYRLPVNSPLDVLGLGVGARSIPAGVPSNLSLSSATVSDQSALKLSNNWIPQKYMALPNQKFAFALGRKWMLESGAKIGNITSLTYSNSYATRSNMQNNFYESFDAVAEKPIYAFNYNANVFNNEYRVGLMHNWAFQTTKGSKFEFKNIFNQVGIDRTATNEGWNNNRQGNFLFTANQYSARTTYSGQLSGDHVLSDEKTHKIDWNLGLAYANRIEPDRQNWSMKKDESTGKYNYVFPNVPSINELGRLFLENHEYVSTGAVNYEKEINLFNIESLLKAGEYTEYKTRNFSERSLCYRTTNSGIYSDAELNALSFNTLFTEPYLGQNKSIKIDEQTSLANKYDASNLLNAGYLALKIPVGLFTIYGGVRAENNRLIVNGHYDAINESKVDESSLDFFPSFNVSYKLSEKNLFRVAYASTINRPEFREKAPLTYYDFTEKNSVVGNPDLLSAYIQNFDLRYEAYPSPNETFTLAAFYKKFTNPIEMVNGGAASQFTFQNAIGATNYGLEVELRRSLETMLNLPNFSATVNASYIYSKVEFADKENERSRPLQGQSPMVVNVALFYQNDKDGISSSLMYNVMGKRILVAATLNQGTVVNPDVFEMPRNVIDFSLNKNIGKKLQLKFGVKDILAQDFVNQQTFEYQKDGVTKTVDLKTRSFNLGRTWSLGAVYKF